MHEEGGVGVKFGSSEACGGNRVARTQEVMREVLARRLSITGLVGFVRIDTGVHMSVGVLDVGNAVAGYRTHCQVHDQCANEGSDEVDKWKKTELQDGVKHMSR